MGEKAVKPARSGAFLVAAGILLSRLSGLIRERVFAHYFGNSDAGDAFKAALKIPNFLQNLLGEGVLSASFIPVYARLLSEGKKDEARRLAGAVVGFLSLIVSILVVLGVSFTPHLIDLIAPGFDGAKRELTITIVRILFPGTGILVLSAWCLGVQNSHGKFFLSYVAPATLNLVVIVGLLVAGHKYPSVESLAVTLAWIQVVGCAFQFFIQMPTVLKLLEGMPINFDHRLTQLRTVTGNFGPVVISRGVVQLSAYIDSILASWLPTGAVSALAYSQVLYTLPVSLFGMAVSASELPELSRAQGDPETVKAYLRTRLEKGLRRIAFFVVPTAVVFVALGDLVVGAIYQTGAFDHNATLVVWGVLAAATVGLSASTQGRLYASAFYALQDTRRPLYYAMIRVALTAGLGWIFAFPLIRFFGWPEIWGTAGLTFAAGLAGFVEYLLLKRGVGIRIGKVGLSWGFLGRVWGGSLVAGAAAWALHQVLPAWRPLPSAVVVLGCFGVVYLGLELLLGLPEALDFVKRKKR